MAPPVRRRRRDPVVPVQAPAPACVMLDGGPEHRGLRPAARAGPTRRPGHRAARRGARAGRIAPHPRRCGRHEQPTPTCSPTTSRPTWSLRSPSTGSATQRSSPTPRSSTPSSSPSAATRRRGPVRVLRPGLNRLHENVVWSQRDNFVSVPTDCPQRDERLGWTGDAQAFAPTACTLFDSQAFWASWLRDLALEQDDELGVPTVVPDVVFSGELAVRPRRLGRRSHDRALGGVRVVRRPDRPARPCPQHAPLGRLARRAPRADGLLGSAASSATGSTRTRPRNGPGRPRPTPTTSPTRSSPQRPPRWRMRPRSSASRR